jgi:hypothetical protein
MTKYVFVIEHPDVISFAEIVVTIPIVHLFGSSFAFNWFSSC